MRKGCFIVILMPCNSWQGMGAKVSVNWSLSPSSLLRGHYLSSVGGGRPWRGSESSSISRGRELKFIVSNGEQAIQNAFSS